MLVNFTSDWLTVDNLGQFNLITGRNGVGKTRLLEDLSFDFMSYDNGGAKREYFYLDTPLRYLEKTRDYKHLSDRPDILKTICKHQLRALFVETAEYNLHYTSMKPMWEKLLGDAHKNKIQVFATAHSMECVRAFSEVATANEYDVRLINIRDTVARGKEVLLHNTKELAEMITDGVELT